MRIHTACLIVIQGLLSLVAQLVVLREIPSLWYGNELSFGVILCAWLLGNALGILTGNSIAVRVIHHRMWYNTLAIISFVILIVTFIGIRFTRLLPLPVFSMITTIPGLFLVPFLYTFPFCFLQGMLFILAPYLPNTNNSLTIRIQFTYVFEAIGAVLGSILWYCSFAYTYTMTQLIGAIGILWGSCILGNIRLITGFPKRMGQIIGALCILIGGLYSLLHPELDTALYQKAYAPLQVISATQSPYGSLIITQHEDEYTFFENNLPLYSTSNSIATESLSQLPLLVHPHPENILILGGGMSGLLPLILQHPSIRHVTYIELDPGMITSAETYLPASYTASIRDPRVTVIIADARSWVAHTTTQYDIILSSAPLPITIHANRYYTEEFFQHIERILAPHGIFSFALPSSESFLNTEQRTILSLCRNTLSQVFPHTLIIPGPSALFFARNEPQPLSIMPDSILLEISKRKLSLSFINDAYLSDILSLHKHQSFEKDLQTLSLTTNTDMNPRIMYYVLTLCARMLSTHTIPGVVWCMYLIGAFTILIFVIRKSTGKTKSLSWGFIIGSVGFISMSFHLIGLYAAQLTAGALYIIVGFLSALIMCGIATGCFLMSLRPIPSRTSLISLLRYGIVLLSLFLLIIQSTSWNTWPVPLSLVVIGGAVFLSGVWEGMMFATLNTYYRGQATHIHSLSTVSIIELLGAGCGALCTYSLILPLFGMHAVLGLNAFLLLLLFAQCLRLNT